MEMSILLATVLLSMSVIILGSELNAECNDYYMIKYGEPILNEISRVSDPTDRIVEYRQFLDKMSQCDMSSTAAVMLGYLIKKLRNLYPQNIDLGYIISNLPSKITKIPWDKTMNIYNQHTKEFLCARRRNDFDETDRPYIVFSSADRGGYCYWNFIVESNGRYFSIQNNANKQNLFAAAATFDYDQRRILLTSDNGTDVPFTSDKWQFKPYHSDVEDIFQYQLKNFLLGEYLGSQESSEVLLGKISNLDTEDLLYQWRLIEGSNSLPASRASFLSNLHAHYNGYNYIAVAILQYASNSPTRTLEYLKLFELMKKYDGFNSFAGSILDFHVQQLLNRNPNDYNLIEMGKHFRTLWKRFPWNRRVTIQNRGDRKFLCRTKITIFQTLATRMEDTIGQSCYWKIETDSSGFNFRIISYPPEYYLEAESTRLLDLARRNIELSRKSPVKDSGRWQLMHERNHEYDVQIKNLKYDEIFYSVSKSYPITQKNPDRNCMVCRWEIREA